MTPAVTPDAPLAPGTPKASGASATLDALAISDVPSATHAPAALDAPVKPEVSAVQDAPATPDATVTPAAPRVALIAITRQGVVQATALADRLQPETAAAGTVAIHVPEKLAGNLAEPTLASPDNRTAPRQTFASGRHEPTPAPSPRTGAGWGEGDPSGAANLSATPGIRILPYVGPLSDQIGPLFAAYDQLVFFVSLGAVTRLVAPHLRSKHQDPGVLVIDEAGRFVIPALSGHVGGANAFAERIGRLIGATVVITTASDVGQTLAVDLLGRDLGWRLEAPKLNITRVSAQVVNGEPIALIQECGRHDWWRREEPLPANIHCFERFEDLDPAAFSGLLWITRREISPDLWRRLAERLVVYRPPEPALEAAEQPVVCRPPEEASDAAERPAVYRPPAQASDAAETPLVCRSPEQAPDDAQRPEAYRQPSPAPEAADGSVVYRSPEQAQRAAKPRDARPLFLGLGCDRHTDVETLAEAVRLALAECGAQLDEVAGVATIDRKGDELAILALTARHGWPLALYAAAKLAQVPVPNPSVTVLAHMGTPAVSEAAALLAAASCPGSGSGSGSGAGDLAISRRAALMLEKFKYRGPDGKNATVSIARRRPIEKASPYPDAPRSAFAGDMPMPGGHPNGEVASQANSHEAARQASEKQGAPCSPQPGKLYLVSLGPGGGAHMTLRALQAIAEAEVVIGYGTYLKLIPELLTGKEIIRKGMTEELDRSLEAYEQARRGRRVALVSSGDIGVYGMAGPTFEVLLQAGWRPGAGVEVELVPGCTALAACASLVGAPLTHDFCSISLSDLLTPWPVIARRLEAAARGDFVIALYNPKSGKRAEQIRAAQRILLRHRAPETPVAIVKAAYREDQGIQLTRLEAFADCPIGMLSTVLIGNAATFVREGLMVTPRGYANKYEGLTGDAKAGEKAGRSLSQGLEGWQTAIREYRHGHPEASLEDLARRFDGSIEEILVVINGCLR